MPSKPILALSLATLAILAPAAARGDVPPPETQIAAAVLAAPEASRDGATVVGWTADGANQVLREGTYEMICLYDNPADEAFSVACYHESLEPFMARGRELAREGMKAPERRTTRFAEIEAGTLEIPREPRTLYVLHGGGYDAETGEVAGAFLRWVIYVPFAEAADLGLPSTPVPGAPWLMDEGTAGAHIMITPPRPE